MFAGFFGVLIALICVWFSLTLTLAEWRKKQMEDFTALTAAISKLQTDVTTLINSKAQSNQAAIDSATAAVNAVDAAVVAATPAPTP